MKGKRLISLVLSAVLIVSILPAMAFAADSPVTVPEDNGIEAYVKGTTQGGITIKPNQNDTFTMEVEASSKSGSLSFQWYLKTDDGEPSDKDAVPGATGTSYSTSVKDDCTYICKVTDGTGNADFVSFHIYPYKNVPSEAETGLYAYVKGTKDTSSFIECKLGDSITLSVDAGTEDGSPVTYSWVKGSEPDEEGRTYFNNDSAVPGATGSTLVLDSIEDDRPYVCHVSDQNGNIKAVFFSFSMDTGVYAYVKGTTRSTTTITVDKGESAVLSVDSGTPDGSAVKYQWFKQSNYDETEGYYTNFDAIVGATSSTYKVDAINEHVVYTCVVTDKYYANATVDFDIRLNSGLTVTKEASVPFDDVWVYAKPGDTITLTAKASTGMGELKYSWYGNYYGKRTDVIDLGEQANKPSVTITVPEDCNIYLNCSVSDGYGKPVDVDFQTNISGLKTAGMINESDEITVYVEKGGDTTLDLKASVERGELNYRWNKEDAEGKSERIENAAGTLKLTNVTENATYFGYAFDYTGMGWGVTFKVVVTEPDTSVIVNQGVPKTTASIPEAVETAVMESLTESEKAQVAAGDPVNLYIEVTKLDEKTVPEKDKTLAEDRAKAVGADSEPVFLDVSLLKQVGTATPKEVHDTNGQQIRITVEIPAELVNKDSSVERTYYLIHVRDDGTVEIAATGTDVNSLTFRTSRFSTFMLTYKDRPATAGTTTVTPAAPQTGDGSSMLWAGMFVVAAGCAAVLGRKRKEE